MYSFDFKINHIARHIQLPAPQHLGPGAKSLSDAEQIPPLLVLNIQLPMYPVRIAHPHARSDPVHAHVTMCGSFLLVRTELLELPGFIRQYELFKNVSSMAGVLLWQE